MSGEEFVLISSKGQRITLKSHQLLGRDATCDILLAEGQASRRHAEIRIDNGNAMLCDLGSTNGSYINETRIEANCPTAIASGDTIRFDANIYTFNVVSAPQNATVMHTAPLADVNATVMRPLPVVEKTAEKPAEKPVEKATADAPQKSAAPQSWALAGQQAVAGTQLLSGTQLEGIRASLNAALDAQKIDAQNVNVPTLILATGKKYSLTSTGGAGKWEVGRALTCDIVIEDGSVSNNHAQIINDDARWKLIDLMSANGTYVNGEKGLTTYLSSGDQIRFGTVDAVFQLGSSAADKPRTQQPASAAGKKSSSLAIGAIAFLLTLVVIVGVLFFMKQG